MARAGCLWQGEVFGIRLPETHLREELERPSLPQILGYPSLWRKLGTSSSFSGQAHWSCQQKLFYGLKWKVGPFGQTSQDIMLPPPGSLPGLLLATLGPVVGYCTPHPPLLFLWGHWLCFSHHPENLPKAGPGSAPL